MKKWAFLLLLLMVLPLSGSGKNPSRESENTLERLYRESHFAEAVRLFSQERETLSRDPRNVRLYLFSLSILGDREPLFSALQEYPLSQNNPEDRFVLARIAIELGYRREGERLLRTIPLPPQGFLPEDWSLVRKEAGIERANGSRLSPRAWGQVRYELCRRTFMSPGGPSCEDLPKNSSLLQVFELLIKGDIREWKEWVLSHPEYQVSFFEEMVKMPRTDLGEKFLNELEKGAFSRATIYYYRGRIALRNNREKDALKWFEKSLQVGGSRTPFLTASTVILLSLLGGELENGDRVEKWLTTSKSGELCPIFSRQSLSLVYLHKKQYKEAEKVIASLLKFDWNDRVTNWIAGEVAYRLNRWHDADVYYRKSLEGDHPLVSLLPAGAMTHIRRRLTEMALALPRWSTFSGLYGVKIKSAGESRSLRVRMEYDKRDNYLRFHFYHFPLVSLGEMIREGEGRFLVVNLRQKLYYRGPLPKVMETLLGAPLEEKDLLSVAGLSGEGGVLPGTELKVLSYQEGMPKEALLKNPRWELKASLLKKLFNPPLSKKEKTLKEYRQVLLPEEVFSDEP